MGEPEGRIALVTGASRGIGRAIALTLAKAGADVAVGYRSRSEEAQEVKGRVEELGRRCVTFGGDLSGSGEVERLVEEVERGLGPVDILVNNAGLSRPQAPEEITERDWDEVLAANLKSAFLLTQAVLPGMRSRGWGRVVNLSSAAAQLGGIVGPHYAASKAALIGLTHSYASLLARENITANAIAPALVETEMVTSNPKASAENIPVGRFGTPQETAEAALMLVRNGYVTGQTINVNGGLYMS